MDKPRVDWQTALVGVCTVVLTLLGTGTQISPVEGNPTQNNSLGAYLNTAAVPEPGNFVMGVIAAVAGCFFWFFRLF